MRRVWGVYLIRQVTSPALRLFAIAALSLGLVSSVSMKHVIENALSASGPVGFARFSLSAVVHTSVPVQLMLTLALILVVWYCIDALRSLSLGQTLRAGA